MNDDQRRQRIDILTQQCSLYGQLHDSGRLDQKDATKYVSALRELDRLREIEACRYDIMKFAKRYFNNGRIMKPETPSPEFHFDMADLICDEINAKDRNSFVAVVAPRSHAKSMLGTVITALYVACFEIHKYLVIISNRQDGAKQLLATIKYEMMNNDELRRDFGDLYNKSAWSMMEIIAANGVKIQAAGSGDALRGLNHLGERPWCLMDDIEKDPDVLSPDYRDKIQDWVNSVVIPLGSPSPGGTKVIWVGTVLHVDAVLNRVMKNDTRFKSKRYPAIVEWPERMDLWDQWAELLNKRDFDDVQSEDEASQKAGELAKQLYADNKAEMDRGAVVLWPERMSLYDLMVIRTANRKSFLTEYIGDPRDDSTMLFNQFTYFDLADLNFADLDFYGAVDPSLGKNARSDLSAIVTIGKHRRTGICYIVDVDAKRRSPDQIIEDIISKTERFNYRGFAVETVQFQHLFMTDLAKRAALEGAYLPIREIKPNGDKWLRIASMEPTVTNGFVRFQKNQRELIDELENVSVDGGLPRNDDRSDALEMALSLTRQNRKRLSFGTL